MMFVWIDFFSFLRFSSLTHLINGSPLKPNSQLQIGLWLTTWQRACNPHTPSHGFLHFWFTHDRSSAHSELTKHSGRQFGGAPIISGKQLHTAWLFNSRHWLFRPQGIEAHGDSIGVAWTINLIFNREWIRMRMKRKTNWGKWHFFEII